MDGMVQVAAVGVTAALLAGVLRRGAPEFSLVLVLCAGAWMLLTAADSLGAAVALMEELSALAGLDEALLEPVVKRWPCPSSPGSQRRCAGPPARGDWPFL